MNPYDSNTNVKTLLTAAAASATLVATMVAEPAQSAGLRGAQAHNANQDMTEEALATALNIAPA